ncbi:hypothetical protein BDV25DRAFT_134990 [Aspergillus avenaceus]|uniref:Uncharacterized protein n=1 Tax=Aspergillus avenaceus TaxID=36643 RepID=A0A5N6U9G3_ASPAV|nr:hypothetical protein BDV25DRAFT_134990 [Aspergillus avenaceus]
MVDIPPNPNSPSDWQKYAESDKVTAIPLRQAQVPVENKTATLRDVYLGDDVFGSLPAQLSYYYTDVFAFTKPKVTISAPEFSLVQIFARVLTADTPVELNAVPDPDSEGFQIQFYASKLDQPITVSTANAKPVSLELGPGTGNMGALLTVRQGKIIVRYTDLYFRDENDRLKASLETQLRIASSLFWTSTSIATDLCSYITQVTANPPLYSQINTQAAALGQQLTAQAMTGPDMDYAPVLKIDNYMTTVRDGVAVVSAFQDQYQSFQNQENDLQALLDTWGQMIESAETQRRVHASVRDKAYGDYEGACQVVSNCKQHLVDDFRSVNDAANAFIQGIQEWRDSQVFGAVFNICTAIIHFASGICETSFGDLLEGIKSLNDAYEDAHHAAEGSGENVLVDSKTLEALGDCMITLQNLYIPLDDMVQAVKKLESDPDADIPSIGDISGSGGGDADSDAIIALAAWSQWGLESDQQLEFALSNNIEGASEYRLALRKQAVSGSALAQAQVEAVKAGYVYIQAETEVIACDQDIEALKDLQAEYNEEHEIYAQAEARFFDRFLGIKTSLVMEMRKMIWAYKYWALADSTVNLDATNTAEDLSEAVFTLDQDIENVEEMYATDFQPYNPTVSWDELPSNYGPLMLEGLKGKDHTASFTLKPKSDPNDPPDCASVFTNGSHFRLSGLETYLTGVIPKSEAVKHGKAEVHIWIQTSGVYADIQDGKVLHFTSMPQGRALAYYISESGERLDTFLHSSFPTEEHAEPTPFTQWTITLSNPDDLDLTTLTGVSLEWTAEARFSI